MNKLDLLFEFLGNIIITEENHVIMESILQGANQLHDKHNYWSFARDVNVPPKTGYFHMAIVGEDGIPQSARRKYGQMPNPTFTSGTFRNGK